MANGQPCDGGASELPALSSQGAFTRVSATETLPIPVREYLLAQASSDASEQPPGFFSRKRGSVFMTDAGDDGVPFSADHGVIKLSPFIIKLAGCALAFALLGAYFLTAAPVVSKKASGPAPIGPDASSAHPSGAAPDGVQPSETSGATRSELSLVPDVVGIGDGAWSQLVVACGGDAARAGLVINGVVAADPGLRAQSHEAIIRALAVVKRT